MGKPLIWQAGSEIHFIVQNHERRNDLSYAGESTWGLYGPSAGLIHANSELPIFRKGLGLH